MIGVTSMNGNTIGRAISSALRILVVDRPVTPGRRARLRAAREADRAWSMMIVQDDDPTTLDRLAAIMSDRPTACEKCGGHASVCRAIGCDPEGVRMNRTRPALRSKGS